MQLNVVGLDGLEGFDFTSIISSVSQVAQKAAPDLVRAAVDRKLAKLRGQPLPVQGPEDVIRQAEFDLKKITQQSRVQAANYQQPARQAVAPVEAKKDNTVVYVVSGVVGLGLLAWLVRG